MDSTFYFLDLFQAILGIYMVASAVTGKGSVYKSSTIREDYMERYQKALRIFFAIAGPLAIVNAALSYFKFTILSNITYGILIAGLLVIVVLILRMPKSNTARPKK